ncbi:MAG: twin-arginine translocase subunit TatC [Actinomycetota bacterium]
MTTSRMAMTTHLQELRSRLFRLSIAIAVGTFVAFFFHDQLLDLIVEPYKLSVGNDALPFFKVTDAFSAVMRVSLLGGVVLASPVVLYQLWRFIAPALTKKEKRWAYPLSGVFALLFLAGIAVGYVALERGLVFLLDFGGDALQPLIGVDAYLRFATRFILAFGIAFEFPVFLFAAAAMGVLSSQTLRSNRRWAVVIILVAAAVITPSGDPMTLMMLAGPLYLLYEIAILAIRFILRK